MVDYVQIFAKNLREKIHLKVWHERIFITRTYDDDLIVQIALKNGPTFETRILDISGKILNGYTTDYAAYEILQELKRFIVKSYFK